MGEFQPDSVSAEAATGIRIVLFRNSPGFGLIALFEAAIVRSGRLGLDFDQPQDHVAVALAGATQSAQHQRNT
jgi:hypothetical protein